MIRTCSCCSGGNTSMIRSIVDGALCVCRVPKTRWPVSVAVDLVDQCRERRRLPGAGRAGDEDDPARLLGELVQRRRDPELLERLQLVRDHPEGGADGLLLEVHVDAEAREAGNRVREVELPLDLELLLLLA